MLQSTFIFYHGHWEFSVQYSVVWKRSKQVMAKKSDQNILAEGFHAARIQAVLEAKDGVNKTTVRAPNKVATASTYFTSTQCTAVSLEVTTAITTVSSVPNVLIFTISPWGSIKLIF